MACAVLISTAGSRRCRLPRVRPESVAWQSIEAPLLKGYDSSAKTTLALFRRVMVALNEQFHHDDTKARSNCWPVEKSVQSWKSVDAYNLQRPMTTDQNFGSSDDLFSDRCSLPIERRVVSLCRRGAIRLFSDRVSFESRQIRRRGTRNRESGMLRKCCCFHFLLHMLQLPHVPQLLNLPHTA